MTEERFQKYIDYIKNTGGSPKLEWFITDWEPIGERVLSDMFKDNLIEIVDDESGQKVVLI